MRRVIKFLIRNFLIISLFIIILDLTMFNFLPDHYLSAFPRYRYIAENAPPVGGGRGLNANGYYIEHQERGFDIGSNKTGRHWVDGVTYPISSNSIGCFDSEHTAYNRYVYFAGDSLTWGFTPFDQKFGTIIERLTDTEILKCGVSHTGQLHQFSKFVELVKKIGKPPKAIFIFYHSNDLANDYAYPHSTVIQG